MALSSLLWVPLLPGHPLRPTGGETPGSKQPFVGNKAGQEAAQGPATALWPGDSTGVL